MGLFEVLHHLPRLLRLRRKLRGRFLAERPDRVRRHRCAGIQPEPGARTACGGHPHGAVRQSAGLGLASGPGAAHGGFPRSRAVPAAIRAGGLRPPGSARNLHRPSAGRPAAAGAGSRGGAREPRPAIRWPGRCRAAGESRRGGLRAWRTTLRAPSAGWQRGGPGSILSRRWRATGPAQLFEQALARRAPGVAVTAHRWAVAGGAHGRRRGTGRLRYGDARDAAVQAANGRGLSPRLADGACPAFTATAEGAVFCAAEPAGRQAGRARNSPRARSGPSGSGREIERWLDQPAEVAALQEAIHGHSPPVCGLVPASARPKPSSNWRGGPGAVSSRAAAPASSSARWPVWTRPAGGRLPGRSSRPR